MADEKPDTVALRQEAALLIQETMHRLQAGVACGTAERLAEAMLMCATMQAREFPADGTGYKVETMYRGRPEVWVIQRVPSSSDALPHGPIHPLLGSKTPDGWPPK